MQVQQNMWRGEWRYRPVRNTALDNYRSESSKFRLDIQKNLDMRVNDWRGIIVRARLG